MPAYAKTVADEAEAKLRHDEADRLEREVAAKQAATQARVVRWLGLVDQGMMTSEELDRRIAVLDKGKEVELEEEKKTKCVVKLKKLFGTAAGGQQGDKRKHEEESDSDRLASVPVSRFRSLVLFTELIPLQ